MISKSPVQKIHIHNQLRTVDFALVLLYGLATSSTNRVPG